MGSIFQFPENFFRTAYAFVFFAHPFRARYIKDSHTAYRNNSSRDLPQPFDKGSVAQRIEKILATHPSATCSADLVFLYLGILIKVKSRNCEGSQCVFFALLVLIYLLLIYSFMVSDGENDSVE